MRFIKILLIFTMILSQQTFALTYTEMRPEVIDVVKENGVGTEFYFMDETKNIRRMRVSHFEQDSASGGLIIDLDQVDNRVIVDFADEEISIRPTPNPGDYSRSSEGALSESGGEMTDWSAFHGDLGIGVQEGALSALQYAIITNPEQVHAIQQAYQAIEKYRQEIQANQGRIEMVRINLKNSAVAVVYKAALGSVGDATEPKVIQPLTKADISSRYPSSQSRGPLEIQWLSKDKPFIEKAEAVRATLNSGKIHSAMDQAFHDLAKNSLIAADQYNSTGLTEESEFLLDVAKVSADVLIGVNPFLGTLQSLYELVTGVSLVTGEELGTFGRIMAALGVFTAGYALKAHKIFNVLKPIAKKMAPHLMKTYNAVRGLIGATGEGFQLVGAGSEVRKINLRSTINSSWGLTRRHINKHFFGPSKISLVNLDPMGNGDKWMTNLLDLVQRPATKTFPNGVIEVIGKYPLSDQSGFYKLGIRLFKKPNGTFDVVTVLTDQSRM